MSLLRICLTRLTDILQQLGLWRFCVCLWLSGHRAGQRQSPGHVKDLIVQLQRLLDEPLLLSHLRNGIQLVPTIKEETATLVSLYEPLRNG